MTSSCELTSAQLVEYILSPKAIRERCQQLYNLVANDRSKHFVLNTEALPKVIEFVKDEILENYPDAEIPYHSRWRHLDYGKPHRLDPIFKQASSPLELGRLQYELVIPSILVDAGAGDHWSFIEDGMSYVRSEGLAVASVHLFADKALQSDKSLAPRSDAKGLMQLQLSDLERAMQVSPDNPLTGLSGRQQLLNKLGQAIQDQPDVFPDGRLGGLFDHFVSKSKHNKIDATTLLVDVLRILGSIWPGRLTLGSTNLGDTWSHPEIVGRNPQDHAVPFHKLSQWLTYSLMEPLEQFGIEVTDLDALTGLPEYRNGGLLIDLGIIVPREENSLTKTYQTGDEFIIEWRALTVILLDQIAEKLIPQLPATDSPWSLAKILQGGTWSAGRKIAKSLRVPSGGSPIKIHSDGTVF